MQILYHLRFGKNTPFRQQAIIDLPVCPDFKIRICTKFLEKGIIFTQMSDFLVVWLDL